MRLDGRHIHFVGIGGIGMSAIAHMAADCGAAVSGCDATESASTRALASRGCTIHRGHSPAHLEGVELVVRSSAIREDCAEVREALCRHIPVVSRARMLARLARDHRMVGVAGAHGKTTTTWIVGKLLVEAHFDPCIVVGGIVSELRGNYRLGTGSLFVSEVDESDGSLLEFEPDYSIVTNVELEHVDRYPDLDAVQSIFRTYLHGTRREGCVILGADSPAAMETLDAWEGRVRTYGFVECADYRAVNVRVNGGNALADVERPEGRLQDVEVSLPGRHNVQNALAAVALGSELGIDDGVLRQALRTVKNVGRRLEHKGAAGGVEVYDDYAHHPTEIQATIGTLRHMVAGRLIGVFQPHRFTRTLHLGEAFGPCFDGLDGLVLLPIYAAGEAPIEGVSTRQIADAVAQQGHVGSTYCAGLDEAREHLLETLEPGDTLLTMGAGNVYRLGEQVLADLENGS